MLSDQQRETILASLLAKKQMQGGLLPILHEIQDALGYIPADAVPLIAKELNLSRAEVHGVITFYHHFRQTPPAKKMLQICRAEACQAMGSEALWQHACQHLQSRPHGHNELSLEPVYCLGLCSSSPAISINDKAHARVTAQKLDRLLAIDSHTTETPT